MAPLCLNMNEVHFSLFSPFWQIQILGKFVRSYKWKKLTENLCDLILNYNPFEFKYYWFWRMLLFSLENYKLLLLFCEEFLVCGNSLFLLNVWESGLIRISAQPPQTQASSEYGDEKRNDRMKQYLSQIIYLSLIYANFLPVLRFISRISWSRQIFP